MYVRYRHVQLWDLNPSTRTHGSSYSVSIIPRHPPQILGRSHILCINWELFVASLYRQVLQWSVNYIFLLNFFIPHNIFLVIENLALSAWLVRWLNNGCPPTCNGFDFHTQQLFVWFANCCLLFVITPTMQEKILVPSVLNETTYRTSEVLLYLLTRFFVVRSLYQHKKSLYL